jgi:hypothetical protein
MGKIQRTDEDQKRANEMFDSFRDELLKRDLSNTENYDKSILTLSAASLGLSLTAIRFIVPLETANYMWLIKSGWLLLLGSIISSLVAFLVSNRAISVQIANAEDYYIKCIREAFDRKNIYLRINAFLNYVTGLMFAVALTAIVAFVTLNINSGETPMSKKDSNKTASVLSQESANIPAMQKIQGDDGISINSANIPTMQQAPETTTTSQSSGGNGNSSGSGSGDSSSGKE